jgi:hypothetical protein
MLGHFSQRFLKDFEAEVRGGQFQVHFVTASEMVNTFLAARAEREGNPRDHRSYGLSLLEPQLTLLSYHLQRPTVVERGL